jgi:hypothetical protein
MADGGFALLDVGTLGRDLGQELRVCSVRAAPAEVGRATGLSCGTAVMTAQGIRSLGDLAPGDRVLTRNRGFQPLRGITAGRALAHAAGLPGVAGLVRIEAGALGRALPDGDLSLAPDHRLLLPKRTGSDAPCSIVTAADLLDRPGVSRSRLAGREALLTPVFALLELIWAEGLWVEAGVVAADAARGPQGARRRNAFGA